ncbi:hypoxanthine-guanine phosphoribosyltransferase [Striga asiatica]|uniref:Hypoxanthine-guanine phosphoribosyltransferase n=1 Tax=Striga asiatica TaxID=4170 RepID=A0A5A7QHM4_STRAF|nr:hypoxanthine-guanine phosphoribosyltransferase [Striga asiatica]
MARKRMDGRIFRLIRYGYFDWSLKFDKHVERIVFTRQQIEDRASEITADFRGDPPVVVGVGYDGSVPLFLARLVKGIKLSFTTTSVRIVSRADTITFEENLEVRGRHVILFMNLMVDLVENIVDTGRRLSCLIDHIAAKGASSISVCALIDKPKCRQIDIELVGHGKYYCGFEYFSDDLLVGYGLETDKAHENLPKT